MLTARRLPRARRGDDEGLVAVITALVVVLVVMPLLALVVDLGLSRTAGGQARFAADAAALAAAVQHPDAAGVAPAVEAAHRLARDDFGVTDEQWASCVDEHPLPAGTAPAPGNCVSFDLAAKQVRVTLPARRVPSVFSGVLNSSPPAATATSVATWAGFAQPCTLCVPGSYEGGAQRLKVEGGDVTVGDDLTVGPGAALNTDSGRTVSYGGKLTVGGELNTTPVRGGVPSDPFALQLAALAALPAATTSVSLDEPPEASAGLPCAPGTYQDVSECASFKAGVYVLTGTPRPDRSRSNITVKGSGTGVVFYVTCSTPWWDYPVRPASCSAGWSPQPRINVPAGNATLEGHPGYGRLVLAFDPSVTSNQRFSGTGTLTLKGSIDGPGVVLRSPAPGNAGQVVVAGGRVVVGRVLYDNSVPMATPHLTVRAPVAEPLPDGPVRLVPSS